MSETTVNVVHKPCERCGATLHAPDFTFDGPPATPLQVALGVASMAPTYAHTRQRCDQLRRWNEWVASCARSTASVDERRVETLTTVGGVL